MAEGPYHRAPDRLPLPVVRPDLPPPPVPPSPDARGPLTVAGPTEPGFVPWAPMAPDERARRDRRLARWSRVLSGGVIVGSLLLLAASLAWRRPIPGSGVFILIAFPIIFFGHGRTIVGAIQRREARNAARGVKPSWWRRPSIGDQANDLFGGLALIDGLVVGTIVVLGVLALFTIDDVAVPERPAGAPACESVYGDTDDPRCEWAEGRDEVVQDRGFAALFLVFSAIALASAQATLRRTEDGPGGDRG